jgi:hypothetical protein
MVMRARWLWDDVDALLGYLYFYTDLGDDAVHDIELIMISFCLPVTMLLPLFFSRETSYLHKRLNPPPSLSARIRFVPGRLVAASRSWRVWTNVSSPAYISHHGVHEPTQTQITILEQWKEAMSCRVTRAKP